MTMVRLSFDICCHKSLYAFKIQSKLEITVKQCMLNLSFDIKWGFWFKQKKEKISTRTLGT